jgi:Di-haem oxidoreductase, putative peroxidase
MRYAALNQGGDDLAYFGDFLPLSVFTDGKMPEPQTQTRYSDEQLYALALYLYSLKPPPNPNKVDALARRGQKVFEREGCAACHAPPLYTNNKLTPVDGFKSPDEHMKKYDVMRASVHTDPNLTLNTRRGTGYYKVPSLRGVWYRGPFEHSGSVATLEDWFDPRRLKGDYEPSGFRGYKVKARAVKGHEFGLDLSAEDTHRFFEDAVRQSTRRGSALLGFNQLHSSTGRKLHAVVFVFYSESFQSHQRIFRAQASERAGGCAAHSRAAVIEKRDKMGR